MSMVEHLVQALLFLPKPDKEKAIGELLEDAVCRKAAAEVFAEGFVKKLLETSESQQAEYSDSYDDKVISRGKGKKERGRKLRESYVSYLRQSGIQIAQADSVWAKTSVGQWVAIPTATMEWRLGRWFLGLREDKALERISQGGVIMVLLCQDSSGARLDFVIPPYKVKEILPKLSKSKGELKFNIRRVDSSYKLIIPHNEPIDITKLQGEVSILRSGL